ncbi:MAG: helix-turn-helix transcriptional regulator [Candidatus Borkfalkiaceae bacterium]|nr:helix-turn-helix transcriptional regulator [Christensenellaceae bacterium]
MDTYDSVRLRIFQLCEEKHMAIYKLSVKSSVAPSTIKNILYGKSRNPGIVTLKMICDGFGVTLAEFFDEKYFGVGARKESGLYGEQEEVAAADGSVLKETAAAGR